MHGSLAGLCAEHSTAHCARGTQKYYVIIGRSICPFARWLTIQSPLLFVSDYVECEKVSTQHPHRDAATPACQHYATCGGCSLQALSYPAQLAHKVNYVGQILTRVGKLAQADVAAAQQLPVAAHAVYGYRNKVQMAFSSLVWQETASAQQQQQQQGSPGVQGSVQQGFGLGYFLPGSSSVVVPIQECSLAVSAVCHRCAYLWSVLALS